MSSSYTPPNRTDSTGTTSTYGSSTDTDADVRPVRPRGHARDDLGLLLLRLALAAVMLAHGYQKLFLQGGGSFGPTQTFMTQLGVPLPQVSGILIVLLELVGGLAMVFGLFTVIVGIAYAVAMAGAIWYVHLAHGFFVAGNGYEFAALVGIVALTLAITGAGKISLDRAFFGGKRRRRVREAREAGVA